MSSRNIILRLRLRGSPLIQVWKSAAFGVAQGLAAVAVLPGRPVAIAMATGIWLVFFFALHRRGYGATALMGAIVFWLLCIGHQYNFDSLNRTSMLAYTGLTMSPAALAVIVHQEMPGATRVVPLLLASAVNLVLAALAGLHIWHNHVFEVSVTPDVIFAFLQTNPAESTEFIREFLSIRIFAASLFGVACIGFLFHLQQRHPVQRMPRQLLLILLVFPTVLLYSYRSDASVVSSVVENAVVYRRELAEFRALRERRDDERLEVLASKDHLGETYVLVVGESLNRNHMGLYGYHRNTTPRLDSLYRAGSLLKFFDAHSTHTNTMPSLSLALTVANRRNGLEFFRAASILDVARAAGMETVWITNQVLYGPFDHLVSILAHSADQLIPLNRYVGETARTQRYDGATVSALEDVLRQVTERSRLIVVHLSGSHTLYCERFPPDFRRFAGPLAISEFGRTPRDERFARSINCYDNSVLYNDHVVADLIEALQGHGGVSAFLYFADHGEDVVGQRGHHPGRFTFAMAEIPMLAWLSEGYRNRYPLQAKSLQKRFDQVFGADFVFDTLLGIAAIETSAYDPRSDLAGDDWGSGPIEFGILDGAHHFLDEENYRYHQRQSFAMLGRDGLLGRVLPHRVNTSGKLAQVQYDGARGVEVDLLFRSGDGYIGFEVGHDDAHASGMRLEDFLTFQGARTMEKLWFDVKNLNEGNVAAMKAEMVALDQRFGLKSRVIFEAQAPELLVDFGDAGFHTSFYLPTEVLTGLMGAGDLEALNREAARIAAAVSKGRLAAVSFDASLYSFVKRHLEPFLSPGVVYHTWDTTLRLSDPSFADRLRAQSWSSDSRVQTILVSYRSDFTL